ncbi:MAG: S24 family peptidase [Tannerellaceae bacterium]
MSSIERVKKVIDWLIFSKIISSKKELASILGYTPSSLSQILNEKVPLSDRFINKLSKTHHNINEDWINTGKGEMLKTPIEDGTPKRDSCNIPKGMILAKMVPLLPISAQGGSLNEFVKSIDVTKCEQIISPVMDADMALTVAGDSMAPEYPSGSKILVRTINHEAFIEWGKTYVVDTCNGAVIKCIVPSENKDCIKCISINPDPRFAPFDIHKNDIYAIHKVMMCLALK